MIIFGTMKNYDEIIANFTEKEKEVYDSMPQYLKDKCRVETQALDFHYGDNRDVDSDDGGYNAIAITVEDLVDMFDPDLFANAEDIHAVGNWLDIMYLCNNEYSITLYVCKDLLSEDILAKVNELISEEISEDEQFNLTLDDYIEGFEEDDDEEKSVHIQNFED